MAISLVTGPLGTGKSFYAVRKCVDALESNKVVITNFRMTPGWTDRVVDRHPVRWLIPRRRAKLKDRWRRSVMVVNDIETLTRIRVDGEGEGRAVVVLDEAHRFMNARTWKDDDRLAILEWFSLSRKLGFDVYLITQDEKNIDRQVRDLFEYHIRLRNLRKMKVVGIPVSPINFFLAIWQWHAAAKAIVKREWYALNWTKNLYDTMDTKAFGLQADPKGVIRLPQPPSELPSVVSAPASATSAGGAAAPRSDPLERSRRRLLALGDVFQHADEETRAEDADLEVFESGSSNSHLGPIYETPGEGGPPE